MGLRDYSRTGAGISSGNARAGHHRNRGCCHAVDRPALRHGHDDLSTTVAGLDVAEGRYRETDLKDSVTDMMVIDDPEPSADPRESAKNVLKNPRLRMWDYTYPAGGPAVKRVYRSDVVEVVVTAGSVKVTGFDGKTEREPWRRRRRASSRAARRRPSRARDPASMISRDQPRGLWATAISPAAGPGLGRRGRRAGGGDTRCPPAAAVRGATRPRGHPLATVRRDDRVA